MSDYLYQPGMAPFLDILTFQGKRKEIGRSSVFDLNSFYSHDKKGSSVDHILFCRKEGYWSRTINGETSLCREENVDASKALFVFYQRRK